jgi:hypothetical protein
MVSISGDEIKRLFWERFRVHLAIVDRAPDGFP